VFMLMVFGMVYLSDVCSTIFLHSIVKSCVLVGSDAVGNSEAPEPLFMRGVLWYVGSHVCGPWNVYCPNVLFRSTCWCATVDG